MYPVLHQLVSSPKQLSGDQDDRCCAITNFLVLLMRKINQNLAGGVLNVEQAENGGAVVRYGDVLFMC